ncbi:MAG: methionine--tRNA ligase [Clostridia bacterium]|nr:methionine--tRNA ligase [Clostridia bacterium]
MMKEKYYITTAIAYASTKPHFGNTYEVIMTDAVARYKRLRGYDVFFCTGTDEHGQKIELKANDAGITPKEYVDNVAGLVRGVWDKMNTTYDHFIRTTDDYHEESVKHIFKKMFDKGDIYLGSYEGWYCTPCESFFTESQLKDGKCPDCGREVTKASEKAYFFKMSKYADRLIKHIEENPEFIEPESRKKEMINNFLKPGLQDLCVSRTSFKWGIPVDFDPEHVVYVWLDALSNYITALGYDPCLDEQPESFKKNWPADVHVIGKDIMRFHSIYWPIFLMSLDIPLPKKIFGHPWFNFGQDKMSKSRGNVVYADALADKIGVDGVRYYALAEMPYANDGSVTYEAILNRFNTDLANNLGNLVNRTVAMTKKYFDGIIPAPAEETDLDRDLKATFTEAAKKYADLMDSFHIADALAEVFTALRRANKYIDETTPWSLAKDESQKARLGTVLYNLLESIRIAAVLLSPVIPDAADKIFAQIGSDIRDFDSALTFGALKVDTSVGEAVPLFSRIDEAKFMAEIEAEREAAAKEVAGEPVTEDTEHLPQITIDDFAKVELRCAKITACEKVKKAKKLLKLQVDLGFEQRQVVSGIAAYYEPDSLIGKKVVLVTNLAPAKLCGIDSEGMILASGEEKINVIFLPDETPLGSKIR